MSERREFTEPFRSQLIALIEGRNPTPPAEMAKADVYVQKAMSAKPPSLAQLKFLASLGIDIAPGTMQEASAMIDAVLREKKS